MRKTLLPLMLLSTTTLAACGGADREESTRESAGPPPAEAALSVQPAPAPVPVADAPDASRGAEGSDAVDPPREAPEPAADEPAAARGGSGAAPADEPRVAPAPVPAGSGAGGESDGRQVAGAEAVLRRAERAYEAVQSLQADFTQEVTVPLLGDTRHSRGRIYHRRPDRFLMEFTDPAGDVVVADGQYVWMYYPSTDAKQVMRGVLSEDGQQVDLQREFLSNPTARYQVSLAGTEPVGGRPADVLTLVPRQASPYRRVRLWVDRDDGLVRRFEIIEENDSVRRLELRNLQPNVELEDELFHFTPPPGTQVFQG